jgi:predicted amidohydrolase
MRLAAAQVASSPGDIAHNVRRHVAIVEEAASLAAEVVVFPELSLIGYEPRLATATATSPADPRLHPLQAVSDRLGIVVAVGLPLATNGLPRIAMLLFRPREPVVVHAKRLLHEDEVPYFEPGDEPLVLQVGGQRLAPAICFEALQREHVDAVVALGATTYLVSIAKHARGVNGAHERLAAVAREHGLSVVMANAVGPFADGVAGGRSAAWYADGTLAASLDDGSEGLVCIGTEDEGQPGRGPARARELDHQEER